MGEIFDGAFRAVRYNPRVMFLLAAIVAGVLGVIDMLVAWLVGPVSVNTGPSSINDPFFDMYATQTIASLFSAIISLIATTALTGVIVKTVADAVLGRQTTVPEARSVIKGRIFGLVRVSIISNMPLFIFLVLLTITIKTNSLGILQVVMFIGLIAVVVHIWLVIKTMFANPALVLEEKGVGAALRRSFALTRNRWWRLFGIYVTAMIVVGIAAAVIAAPLSFIAVAVTDIGSLWYQFTIVLSRVITNTITVPFSAAVIALLYIDTRMRSEGLDITLQRAAGA